MTLVSKEADLLSVFTKISCAQWHTQQLAKVRNIQSSPLIVVFTLCLYCTERLQSVCELMDIFFVFDEVSDAGDEPFVKELADIVLDALNHPTVPRPAGEHYLGEATRRYVCLLCHWLGLTVCP